MSKVQLSGNASGTGIFQIASPNSNTDRTLTLPDNTGTLMSSASALGVSQFPSSFSVNASAPSGAFTMDASGRITTPNRPAFRANRTSSFSVGANVPYEIVYNSAQFDVNSNYSTSTGRFTAPVTGVYYFTATTQPSSNLGNTTYQFYLNGSAISFSAVTWSPQPARGDLLLSLVLRLTAGDYVSAYTTSTAVTTYDNNGYFAGFLVG